MKEKIFAREVWSKPGESYNNKPLLLFVSKGIAKVEERKMHYVKISGVANPLPFKSAYDVNLIHIDSWLRKHGWVCIGNEPFYN